MSTMTATWHRLDPTRHNSFMVAHTAAVHKAFLLTFLLKLSKGLCFCFFFVIRTESDEDICRGMTPSSSSLGKKLANTQFNHIFIYYLIIYLFIFAIIHCVFFLRAKKTRTDIIWMDIHEQQQQKPILEIRSFFPAHRNDLLH